MTLFSDSESLRRSLVELGDLKAAGVAVVKLGTFTCRSAESPFGGMVGRVSRALSKSLSFVKKIEHFIGTVSLKRHLSARTLVIAVEKEGLIVARGAGTGTLVYYSLELYPDELNSTSVYRHICREEKLASRDLSALVIQDSTREKVFKSRLDLELSASFSTIYMPVSVDFTHGAPAKQKYWHAKFGLANEVKIVLYFGVISRRDRGLEDFISGFSEAGPNWAFVIHGFGEEAFIEELNNEYRGKNVFVSQGLVPEEEILSLVKSSDVGLTWYSCDTENDCHTAFSSEKIALFLSAGKPILTNFGPTYSELYSKFSCGFAEKNPRAFGARLPDLMKNYRMMSFDSTRAYNTFYNFQTNSEKLLAALKELSP